MNQEHQQDTDRSWMRAKWVGPGLALIAFGVYVATLARGAFPGPSARLLVLHTDIDPTFPKTATLWGLIIRLLDLVPWAPLPLLAGLFSAVCGALAVWLMYELMSRMPHDRTSEEHHARFPVDQAQGLSGIAAALFVAFSVPFWVVSNRAHPLSLDALMLLFALLLFIRFWSMGRARQVYGFTFLYGLGTVEYTTFIVVSPIFLVATLIGLWRWRLFRFAPVARVAGCYAAGLLLYVYVALRFWTGPAAEWAGATQLFEAFWMIWRDQYVEIMYGLSQLGWLIIFLVAVLPWLIVMAPKKGASETLARYSSYLLHALLGALAILILFNFRFTPITFLDPDSLLVVPYILISSWAGYVAGYGYVMLLRRRREHHYARRSGMLLLSLRRLFRPVYPAALAVLFAAAAVLNLPEADGRAAAGVNRLAGEVVDRMGERTWLISDGVFDANIQLTAHERGVPLQLLNPQLGRSTYYLRYMATLFEEPRLQSLAQIGLAPMVTEWFSMKPEIEKHLAIMNTPDMWFSQEYYPVPELLLFGGEQNPGDVDMDALYRVHERFWTGLASDGVLEGDGRFIRAWNRYSLRHLGKVANNLGVFLDERGRSDRAYDAYHWARRLDTNNASALLNLMGLAHRENRPELAEYEAEFDRQYVEPGVRLDQWNLSYHFGYVRAPEMHVGRGYAWAATGRPHAALSELQRAAEMGAGGEQMEMTLAALFMAGQRPEESEQALLRVLERNPDQWRALLGLARIAMSRGDYGSAAAYLGRLEAMNVSPDVVDMQRALLDALTGQVDEARQLLRRVVRRSPDHYRAWAALGVLALQEGDMEEMENAMNRLARIGSVDPQVFMVLAQMHASADNHAAAEQQLEQLLRLQPNHVGALEWMLRYDLANLRKDQARNRAERLLMLDSDNSLANYVLGTFQYEAGHYLLAESSFRASLRRERNFTVLGDLAWLLQRRGVYDEALLLAREAVEMEPGRSEGWHTLGLVLVRKDELEEAEAVLERALALNPDNPYAKYYLSLLYERKGMISEAIRLLDEVLLRGDPMVPEVEREARASLTRMRRMGAGG